MRGRGIRSMEVRIVSGQEGSWREDLYNKDSLKNPGNKG